MKFSNWIFLFQDPRHPMEASLYDQRSPTNSPAHEGQLLLNPRREKKYGHLEDAYAAKRDRKGNSMLGRYSSDPCKVLQGHPYINGELETSAAGRNGGPRSPGFEIRLGQLVFPLGKEINRHCWVAHFAGDAHWTEPSPLFANRARPSPLKCKTSTWCSH